MLTKFADEIIQHWPLWMLSFWKLVQPVGRIMGNGFMIIWSLAIFSSTVDVV